MMRLLVAVLVLAVFVPAATAQQQSNTTTRTLPKPPPTSGDLFGHVVPFTAALSSGDFVAGYVFDGMAAVEIGGGFSLVPVASVTMPASAGWSTPCVAIKLPFGGIGSPFPYPYDVIGHGTSLDAALADFKAKVAEMQVVYVFLGESACQTSAD